jgi:hypothetical protein
MARSWGAIQSFVARRAARMRWRSMPLS